MQQTRVQSVADAFWGYGACVIFAMGHCCVGFHNCVGFLKVCKQHMQQTEASTIYFFAFSLVSFLQLKVLRKQPFFTAMLMLG